VIRASALAIRPPVAADDTGAGSATRSATLAVDAARETAAESYLPPPGPVPRVPGFIGLGKIGCGLGAGAGNVGLGAAMTVFILPRGREFDEPDRYLGDQGDDGYSERPT
jgi:hypothetical protein